jgi:hypothetical protein
MVNCKHVVRAANNGISPVYPASGPADGDIHC